MCTDLVSALFDLAAIKSARLSELQIKDCGRLDLAESEALAEQGPSVVNVL